MLFSARSYCPKVKVLSKRMFPGPTRVVPALSKPMDCANKPFIFPTSNKISWQIVKMVFTGKKGLTSAPKSMD